MTHDRLDDAAQTLINDLVDASRRLGSDPSLVLHGGGNSSVKTTATDITGASIEALHVKASGHDLATITADGFAPMRLARLRELLPPTMIGDLQLKNELRCALLDSCAPDPSVETLVHALLPQPAVMHSHADAVLALTNTTDGEDLVRQVFGERVVICDYAMPGADLARVAQAAWAEQSGPQTLGMVVLQHGLFTVGDTPSQALERHLALVAEATAALPALDLPAAESSPASLQRAERISLVRKRISESVGMPVCLRRTIDDALVNQLRESGDLTALSHGPLTPDHVIWTKPFPLMSNQVADGDELADYAQRYTAYVHEHAGRRSTELTMLDTAPRVIVDDELGLLVIGRTPRECTIAADITHQTMVTIPVAQRLGGYVPASSGHVFDLEYWELQQEKLHRSAPGKALTGRIALVTGAASGIGKACAAALLDAGAAVIGWDLTDTVTSTFADSHGELWFGQQVDVTDSERLREALAAAVEHFGGLDILVPAAGIFPTSADLGVMELSSWRRTMAVNVDSVAELYGLTHPFLAQSPLKDSAGGGRVVVIASKNVLAPGTGAAAYSSSKAALTQLSRVAALEWAKDGIRVNLVHPDAVFDTGLWTPELLAARAEHYGLNVEEYKRRNLLRAEVTSAAVGRLALAMADDTFTCTTGAQVPIDGGSDRVI